MATKVVNLSETNLTCFFLDVFRQHSSQSITVSVVSCVVTSLFAYTAVMANGATMLVIWKTRELHSLSFTLLFCLAFLIFWLDCLASSTRKLRLSQFSIGWITGGLSFVILSGVSFDRLLSLKLHLRYKATITVPRVLALVASLLVCLSILTILKLWLKDNWIIIPTSILLVTSLVTAVSTFQIFQIARKHQRQIFQQNQTMGQPICRTVDALKCKKSAVTVLYVYGLMLAFYLPFISVVMSEAILGVTQSVTLAYDVATAIVFINSSLNPFIYCWRMAQIRFAVKNILKNFI